MEHDARAFRRELYSRFSPPPFALSPNGRDVRFVAPVETDLRTGNFAVLRAEPTSSAALVVQIRSAGLEERRDVELSGTAQLDVRGMGLEAIQGRPVLYVLAGTGVIIGALEDGTFVRRDAVDPFGELVVAPATSSEVATIAAGLRPATGGIEIGALRQTDDVAAVLSAKGFSRHTLMCGQSGSGKTYTTGGLFERLLADTTLPLVILDPNSDHIHLGSLNDPDDTSPEAERFRSVAGSVRVARARGCEASYILCADFSDLAPEWQALLLRLHPVADADEYAALRRITTSLTAPYSIDDVVERATTMSSDDPLVGRVRQRIGNLGIADWDVWRRGSETSIVAVGLREQRCVVFDLGSLARADERTAVALALLGTRWRLRHERSPVLIAIDEAHNVVPAHTDDPLLAATSDLGVLIAGEGRKFGLHLFLATQRPAKVHPNVVSQCDNLILMRMNGVRDVDDLVSLFSHVPEPMLREALGFGLGQALFAGPISPVPTFAKVGRRLSPEGGGDIPTTWAT
jgi:uncharacterized protein